MNGVTWQGSTAIISPDESWNLTQFSSSGPFSANASAISVAGSPALYAGQTISGPGIAFEPRSRPYRAATVYLSQPTTSAETSGIPLVAQSDYTVLQLTAQNSAASVTKGQTLNIYDPIFASNTRFVEVNGAPPPPMPSWLAAAFNRYETPSEMVFGCDGFLADNSYDPNAGGATSPLGTAWARSRRRSAQPSIGALHSICAIKPSNWSAFPTMTANASVAPDESSTLAAGTIITRSQP